MLVLPLLALLALLGGPVIFFSILFVLRAAGAFGAGPDSREWLPLTRSGAFGTWGDPQKACPAIRDRVYWGANLAVVSVGAVGLALFSSSLWVNLALAAAYLGATFLYFRKVYGVWACQPCYYFREAHVPLTEYQGTEERTFKLRYRLAIFTWYVLAWVWPVTLMAYAAWELGRTVEVVPLAVMVVALATVFTPVLSLRVCKICRINSLGMCPMPWKDIVMPERAYQATETAGD